MSQRIFITGGAGFIGSHTTHYLLSQGKQVIVLDNLSSGNIENLPMHHPDLEFIEGDVLEYPLVEELIQSCDAVLHLAAIASVPLSIETPIYTFQVNVQGFLHVLEAIRKCHRPVRLVYASSAAVYGDAAHLPCRDDQPLVDKPLSPYALHKKNTEQYADLYAALHQLPSLGLRYFNVYGQGQDPASPYSGVISRFLDSYKNQTMLTIYGDGEQSRDFIHVSDIVKANAKALESNYAGVLNIATGKPETLLNLLQYLEAAGNKPASHQFAPARAGDIRASYAAIETAKQTLAFQSTISLKDGIKSLI